MKLEGVKQNIRKSDLDRVVRELSEEALEKGIGTITKAPREYLLKRDVTIEALESFSLLPFENSLYDYRNKLRFVTGGKRGAQPDYSIWEDPDKIERADEKETERWRKSRFHLHNHRLRFSGAHNAVSRNDFRFGKTMRTEINFILTPDGIIGYKPDPFRRYYAHGDYVSSDVDAMVENAYRFQNPNRTIRQQLQRNISSFFVPFRGDKESQKKLGLICAYINDPSIEWGSIRQQIEAG
ncbi:hypothetical protein A3A40_03185 [Candidatus Kaiserbacteria bacterium RIFCSPLOWO2_01_FULL_54_20]|uniref:Uncharacterized protein n=1 Tax=Candidatus Kaiserbacteria bacterium RIFCSPLOWO2_01_FULL_54_20 TaxID=1798513 RepID=A0A1F6EKI5_9BACT|nr:MAG: hypothetical protein A3A40_03185 [Candidatus Kaiserbacteria bacterium RIFCSPLOWO2_01_FULL_54_20]